MNVRVIKTETREEDLSFAFYVSESVDNAIIKLVIRAVLGIITVCDFHRNKCGKPALRTHTATNIFYGNLQYSFIIPHEL